MMLEVGGEGAAAAGLLAVLELSIGGKLTVFWR